MDSQKQRERRYLDLVIESADLSPSLIEQTEEPDFLLCLDSRTVGVEVTELYLPRDAGKMPTQALENEERIAVQIALDRAIENDIPSQLIQTRLSRHGLNKKNRLKTATALYEYVAQNYAAPGEVKSGDSNLPPEIVNISMFGQRESSHQWNGACAGWVNSEFTSGFEAAIDKKESLRRQYLTRCEKCWLVIVATGEGGSSFIEWSNVLAMHEFQSGFDLVYFVQGLDGQVFPLKLSPLSR